MARSRTALLIPYHEDHEALMRSLASVQDSETCDVIVVDDGSLVRPVDLTAARAAFRANGSVTVVRQSPNAGIDVALNTGLERVLADGYEFVARLDCGDRHVGPRLSMQEAFLDANPQVLLVGGAVKFIDLEGRQQFILRMPTDDLQIRRRMWANSAFMHPTVMFRSGVVVQVGLYPNDYPAAEDYAFFWSVMDVGEVANLPDVVLEYEVNPEGISLSNRSRQLSSRLAVQRAHDDGSMAARLGRMRTRVIRAIPSRLLFRLKRVRHRGEWTA